MNFIKKTSIIALSTIILSLSFQPMITHAEESGINIKVGKNDGILSTGIWGTSTYSADYKKVTFIWNNSFIKNLNQNYGTNTVFEMDPDLIPYVDRLEVVTNMNHGTNPGSQFILLQSSPGVFICPTSKLMQVGNCKWAHTAQATIVLKTPVNCLPKDKYTYSVKLTDPRQGNQYVLKTRDIGVIEKKPVQYSTLNYGVFKSMFGFNVGRPLSSDKVLQLRYCVEYKTTSFKYSNFEFHFDPCLVDYIDHVDIYHASTRKLVSTMNMTNSGILSIPCRSVYPKFDFYKSYPVDLKVYLKDGYTIGDLPNDVYTVTALSTYSPSNGSDIHKNSVCTLGFNTHFNKSGF